MLCIFCTIVVEKFVVCSNLLINFIHVLLYNCRKSIVIRVTCFSCLEEDIRVLCRTSLAWMVRIQSMFTELCDSIHISHIFQIFIIPCLDFLDFMGSTESIKEVDERNFSLDCCKVSNRCQVHYFLYGRFTEHSTSCLTACHNIRVISKDRKCVRSKCTGRYIDNARKLLACDLIKVRDHQKKTLRCCVSSCKSTSCQRTVNCTCSTCLRLHLCNLYFLSEDVLSSLGCPLVCSFSHNR